MKIQILQKQWGFLIAVLLIWPSTAMTTNYWPGTIKGIGDNMALLCIYDLLCTS